MYCWFPDTKKKRKECQLLLDLKKKESFDKDWIYLGTKPDTYYQLESKVPRQDHQTPNLFCLQQPKTTLVCHRSLHKKGMEPNIFEI